jgi:uroporphyrinogen-III synthase
MPPDVPLAGLRVVAFEARRAAELTRMLERHGARVTSAPALREDRLADSPAARELAAALAEGSIDAVVLLTGVGTKALAAAAGRDDFPALLERTRIVARGPKPLAALRELGVSGAHPVPAPHTWREALGVLDGLGLPAQARVAVQEYGAPPDALLAALAERPLRVLRVPVYRWALPDDPRPLRDAARALVAGELDVAVFTSAVQVEHLFGVADDAGALRAAFARVAVVSIGPVCSEGLDAHGVHPDLEPSPPKMGPLVALAAERCREIVDRKRR